MVIQCPMCLGRYKVKNENLVPPQGIGIRCPNCANIFTIYRIATDIELLPLDETSESISYKAPPAYEESSYAPPERSAATAKESVFHPKPSIFEPGPPPSFEQQEVGVRVTPSEEVFGAATAVRPAVEAAAALPPELKKMHDKAKRLARVLVKDIVLYHADKVEKGLKEGNLVDLIGDEIKKSWQYYKGETPEDVLNSTNYFKEALNQILAKGKKIFT